MFWHVTKIEQATQLPRMCIKIPGVADTGCQPVPERKSLTLEYVNTKRPEDQRTNAYTDGSAAEATRDVGGGVYIRYTGGKAHITIVTGKYSTIFRTESEAEATKAEEYDGRRRYRNIILLRALSKTVSFAHWSFLPRKALSSK